MCQRLLASVTLGPDTLPKATQGCAGVTLRGRYREAIVNLECQKPDALIWPIDILLKNAWTVANFLKSCALAYTPGCENFTTLLMSWETLALEQGTRVRGFTNKLDVLACLEALKYYFKASTGHKGWCSPLSSLKACINNGPRRWAEVSFFAKKWGLGWIRTQL